MGTRAAIEVMERFFWAMERGEVIYPEPGGTVTSEEANRLVGFLDAAFERELIQNPSYFANKGIESKGVAIDRPPDFWRLGSAMRKAFAEAFYKAREQPDSDYKPDVFETSSSGGNYPWQTPP